MGSSGDWIAPALIATGIGAFAAPSVYQAQETKKAQKKMAQQQDQQTQQYAKLQADLAAKNEETVTVQAADAARRSARKRQLALASGGTGRQDTILTSGLGSTGSPAAQQKTLLGA